MGQASGWVAGGGAACSRPGCADPGCTGGWLDSVELACVYLVIADALDDEDEHLSWCGGPDLAGRVRVSAGGRDALAGCARGVLDGRPVDPDGWPLLIRALLEAELPLVVGSGWAAEVPSVVDAALARVTGRLACIAHAAGSGELTADCRTPPSEHLGGNLRLHLMAALDEAGRDGR